MSTDPYSKRVRDLFDVPAHAGSLDGASTVEVSDQGVRVRLYAAVVDAEIRALRFQAWGCPHTIAAAEAFCAGYEGRPVVDLLDFSVSDLMQSLSVPVEKTGRILVIEDAVRSLGSEAGAISIPDD
ncbi:MAG: iron-sulfur cluster assembly scaffold protein [Gammaproteobacteria bacterium]|nr:iron-sulfur cluster assembly scaffold protein [Gammaproteobacteria bacterium]MDH3374016.1 iron-sulfur cluster assembly scaffold protein [Gammaproteobacteria bacterium]MDH3410135.1 iron-sulfur cluster assembly scaffold protein [Gammaproteobacteria bacterium]MDH3553798.1 iron-sulfur cluster assembly scaffold protein [Gammaproteobacteria bacterium]